jgi:hypothetical protein
MGSDYLQYRTSFGDEKVTIWYKCADDYYFKSLERPYGRYDRAPPRDPDQAYKEESPLLYFICQKEINFSNTFGKIFSKFSLEKPFLKRFSTLCP